VLEVDWYVCVRFDRSWDHFEGTFVPFEPRPDEAPEGARLLLDVCGTASR
jgi:hypothetical protein